MEPKTRQNRQMKRTPAEGALLTSAPYLYSPEQPEHPSQEVGYTYTKDHQSTEKCDFRLESQGQISSFI